MARYAHRWRLVFVLLAWWSAAIPAAAVTIRIDYRYDNGFFSTNNPQGAAAAQQAKAALEAAAGFFTSILTDPFSPIVVPDKFTSKVWDGQVTWEWSRTFTRPSGTGKLTLDHKTPGETIAAYEYVVYAGARNMNVNSLGTGSPGEWHWESKPSGSFTSAEVAEASSITATFESQVERREQTSGFATWGGSITFNRSPSSPWHYNHTSLPPTNRSDFFSVAVHELAHALGFGTSAEWMGKVTDLYFYGANARNKYGGSPVPLADSGHWASSVMSTVYGGTATQQTAMSPSLTTGTRKHFTELDAAAMKDIGWSVAPLPTLFGDYNGNHVVDAADYVLWRKLLGKNVTMPNDATPGTVRASDYTVWRQNFGKSHFGGASTAVFGVPEPSSASMVLVGCAAGFLARRRRRG